MPGPSTKRDTVGTALVTGAAKRVGRTIALDLARNGWNVAVHYNTSAREAHEVVAAIRSLGCRSIPVQADLAVESEVETVIPQIVEELGPLDVVVNNASIYECDQPDTATRVSWDRHMDINLRAPLVLTQHFVAQLPDEVQGNVVNLIDQRVLNLTPRYTSYSISKAGLWALTQHLAVALAPRVRVNAIGPGVTLPGPGITQQEFERRGASMLLGRGTSPEEVARAMRFVLKAPAMTGQMIVLDGGQHLGWLSPGELEPDRSASYDIYY